MKTLVAAACGLLAVCGSAFAADMALPVPVQAPIAPPPGPRWTGCYAEAGGGYGFWNQKQHTETFPGLVAISSGDTTDGGRGWFGRFGGGCDYQFNGGFSNWVIGAFGEYDVMDLQGTNNFQNVGPGGAFGPPVSAAEKENNAWYVGGRIGYLITPALLSYFDGGYTQTHFNQQNLTVLSSGASTSAFLPAATYNGWFLGSGVEYALSFSWLPIQGLFWRNEYRFASYKSMDLQLLGPGANAGFAQHTTPYVQTITSSLIWRFSW